MKEMSYSPLRDHMKVSTSAMRFHLCIAPVLALSASRTQAEDALVTIERLAAADPKPFALVEATGKGNVNRAQGVVISPRGHVLSVGHVSWVKNTRRFSDKFRVSFRGTGQRLPGGLVHAHKAVFSDYEDATFFEHYYSATQLRNQGSRFVGQGDLAIFQIEGEGPFPHIDFYADAKPEVKMGDVFHLGHYSFPHKAADPTFLINPVKVVGVARTPFGMQYLAEGYYRVGSSGGAILKDGRLIGIQSAAYTVNASDVGEIPLGLISFQLVWRDLIEGALPAPHHSTTEEELPESTEPSRK